MRDIRHPLALAACAIAAAASAQNAPPAAASAPPPPPFTFFVTSVSPGQGANYGGPADWDFCDTSI